MAKTDAQSERNEFSEIFNLPRKSLTAKLVADMEQCLRDAHSAREDLKQIVASAKAAQFGRREVEAMKKIAQLRMKDQLTQARDQLAALERVGHAVGFDLFRWADEQASSREDLS